MSKDDFRSATKILSKGNRQYHIGLAPGEAAPRILLCGDPKRAEKTAELFDAVKCDRRNREYVTITGAYKGMEVTVMGTGIGADNVEIAIVELAQIVDEPTFIRIGSCGSLLKDIQLGDLIVSTGAVRLEATSSFYAPETYPAVANYEVVVALVSACAGQGARYHTGITASAPGFYGAQSRKIPRFPPRYPDLPESLAKIGVANFEMEISALLTICSVGGLRAGAVCAVYAHRPTNKFIDPEEKERAELRCIQAGLGALERLEHMDKWKRQYGKKHWHV